MALRRDPLDELIEELEHAVPPTAITASHLSLPLEDLQWAVGLVLYAKTEEQRAEANRVTNEITTPGYRTRFPSNRGA